MDNQSKTRVIGAFLVGFAIVGGAYTLSNFGQSSLEAPVNAATAVVAAPSRVPLPVSDTNNDGIEDWRETFLGDSEIIVTNSSSSEYTIPDTLTDQVGIVLLQEVIRNKGYGAIGKSDEEIIADTVKQMASHATDKIYDVRDIVVSEDISPIAIRTYGNAMANALILNSNPDLRHELIILREFSTNQSPKAIEELAALAEVYRKMLEDSLQIPVPSLFVKQHLDTINVYNAVYQDILAMSLGMADPALSLIRLKRYEEDALGLALALQNLYLAVEPYAEYFERDDPAIIFVNFSPNYQ